MVCPFFLYVVYLRIVVSNAGGSEYRGMQPYVAAWNASCAVPDLDFTSRTP